MSFEQLPVDLVAEVFRELSIGDIENIKMTSKRNYAIVKRFNFDKIALDKLILEDCIGYYPNLFVYSYEAFEKNEKVDWWKRKSIRLANVDLSVEHPAFLLNAILKKCSYIKSLDLNISPLDSSSLNQIIMSAVKIGQLCIRESHINTNPSLFMDLCKKADETILDEVHLRKDLWTDEVMCESIANALIITRATHREVDASLQLSNKTLQALMDEKPKEFNMSNIRNSFTIEKIVKAFKSIMDSDITELVWRLGILPDSEDEYAAMHFEEINGTFDGINYSCEYHGRYGANITLYSKSLDVSIDFYARIDIEEPSDYWSDSDTMDY